MNVSRNDFDVLVVADSRFAGGSTEALVADVTAFAALGLRIGLLFVRSSYLHDDRDPANPKALALRDLDGVTTLRDGATARAPVAFLHHPLVFYRGIEERADLTAQRAVIVTHHAPFRADGSLEYDPLKTLGNIRRALGLRACFAPISGVVRRQLASFAPLISLAAEDWPNIFNPADWPDRRPLFQGPLVIGRHGRADPLKWPANGPDINAGLPARPDLKVRVLGCPVEALRAKGARLGDWEILPFGSEAVPDFLNSLDVFVYHYHPKWVESFGRTIAEALLCGRLCLLDPRLRATFGSMARYCTPQETADALDNLRANPAASRNFAEDARQGAISAYGRETLAARLARLHSQQPARDRSQASVPPIRVARKLLGHHRRRADGATG
ncbi:glycosyltransferase family 1 protein [Sulfitobacter aestuarii]|uniref:Glycosyltransferase family 1 protein n=1 Tax=Sulfitobacter aestuarii TaxID=2161676 RepID=A0ABW5U538_9RHOB